METDIQTALHGTQAADDFDEIEIEEGVERPRITDGTYNAKLLRWEAVALRMFGNSPRMFLHFEIIDPGPYLGIKLYGGWPLRKMWKQGGKTRYVAARRGRLHTMLRRLLGATARADRISFASLKGCVLSVRTRTVKKNHQHQRLDESMQYSVVDEIEEVVAGEKIP